MVLATVAFVLQQFTFAQAGAMLAVAWYIAGQVAAVIDHQKWQRDQPPRQ